MFVEDFAYMSHKLVLVVVRLVDIVEHIIVRGHIVNHELHESHDTAIDAAELEYKEKELFTLLKAILVD